MPYKDPAGFWARVDKSDDESGCWSWAGTRKSDGYGMVYSPELRRPVLAHRAAYELLIGAIPEGLTLDHLCRNRACVNPAHLEPVTNRENVLRGEGLTARNARATHCVRGHPFDAENTVMSKDGRRGCLICTRARKRIAEQKRRDRKKALAPRGASVSSVG